MLVGERGRGDREPRVEDQRLQGARADQVELDEHRGVAVEVRGGEDALRARREHRLLLVEVLDGEGENRPRRGRLVTEALDVRLAEGPLPRERLLADEPG